MSTQDVTKRNIISEILNAGLKGKKNLRQSERFKFYARKKELDLLDQADEAEIEKEAKRLRRLQLKQAQYYADLLPRALQTQKQYDVELQYKKNAPAARTVNRVKIIPPVMIHHDYFMIQIDMEHLPTGVSADALRDPKLLESLGFAMQTEVGIDAQSKERGFWYLVARRGGVGIIPRLIGYEEVMKMMPKRASSWAIPIGVGENKKLTWLDIRAKPHFLIAGTTGSGKSVFLKNMLLTLCANNSPERLRVILADFKAGADLIPLVKLPHLGTPTKIGTKEKTITGVDNDGNILEDVVDDYANYLITEPDDLIPILNWADRETNRRNRIFAKVGDVTNINEYNGKFRRKPLPRVLIVLDEFPVAMLEVGKTQMKALEQKISAVTRKGRSAGISIILGSQVGSAAVISGAISQNIGTRLAGFSTGPQSQVLLGSWAANRIENRPGRMAYKDDLAEKELQTPWLSQTLAKSLVAEIVTRWSDGHDEDATALALFAFCLDKAGGIFDPETLYKYFPDDEEITNMACREIGAQYEMHLHEDGVWGPVIRLLETDFYLLPAVSGPSGRKRKLVTVEDYQLSILKPLEPQPPAETTVAPAYAWTEEEVLTWSVLENGGHLGQRDVYKRFKPAGMTKKRAELFGPTRLGLTFGVEGTMYQVVAGMGKLPIRLVTCDSLESREVIRGCEDTDIPPEVDEASQNALVDELPEEDTPVEPIMWFK
jgi:hypothetical protein